MQRRGRLLQHHEDHGDDDVTIEAAFLNEELRAAATEAEIATGSEWQKGREDATNVEHMQKLLKRHGQHTSAADLERDGLIRLLGLEDRRTLDEVFGAAQRCELKAPVPLYLWLVDGVHAVFAIPSQQKRSNEHGFYTMDPRLISGLLEIRARYINDSV